MTLDRSAPQFSVRLVLPKTPPKPPARTPSVRAAEDALRAYQRTAQSVTARVAAAGGKGPNLPAGLASELVSTQAHFDSLYRALRAAQAEARASSPPEPPQPKDEDLTLRVVSFEYDEDEKKADQLTLTVDNRDLSAFDNPAFGDGNKLVVSWGYAGNTTPPVEMIIRSVKGALQLKVVAQSKAVLMNRETHSRVFENKTRAEVARLIAEENGYGSGTLFVEDTGVRYPHIAQARLTDAQFLKRLADIEGFEFYVDFEGIHWKPRDTKKRPLRVLQYYLPPNVGDILAFDVENDLTAKPGAITVKGRDPLKKADINVTADNASTKRTTLGAVVEIVDPRTGATERRPNNASADTRVSSASSEAAAKREADGAYKRTQLAAVLFSATIVGDPRFRAKNVVVVQGLGKRLSGKYYVSSTKHKIDGSGYTVSFKARTDGGNKRVGPKAATAGSQNKQDPSSSGTAKQVEVVNPQTGATTTQWKAG